MLPFGGIQWRTFLMLQYVMCSGMMQFKCHIKIRYCITYSILTAFSGAYLDESSLPARMYVVCWQLKVQGEVEATEVAVELLEPLQFLWR